LRDLPSSVLALELDQRGRVLEFPALQRGANSLLKGRRQAIKTGQCTLLVDGNFARAIIQNKRELS
jgi:hypothetical protein